ncbi:MAG: HAD family hydrolase [Erysipelothrix sp.]|jgi:FMN phosphatase YigB (HAD superfamily)|nr:HAD family hydrolase [Erysipelothrix sp.]
MKAILFDLDGTLLPINMDDFESLYFKGLSSNFMDWMHPKELIEMVWKATVAMVMSQDDRTNEEVFFEAFTPLIGEDRLEEAKKRFENFYLGSFSDLKKALYPTPSWKPILKELRGKGYKLVCATNPIFPRIATQQRLSWIGLDFEDFELVTTFESSKACKPQLKYYQDIFGFIGVHPHEAIMVGNDTFEDTVVSHLGTQTFLVTNYIKESSKGSIPTTYRGDRDECIEFLKQLPTTGEQQ